MKLKCLLVGHVWVDIVRMNDEGYLFTECDYCGEEQEERGATALICEDCDGEGWVLAEDICDDECCASPQEDFPAYLCPSCDGHGME